MLSAHPSIKRVWEEAAGEAPDLELESEEHDVLRIFNPHPRDGWIRFEARRHLYAISMDGERWVSENLTSVTKLIDYCKPPFPGTTVATAIANKQARLEAEFFADSSMVATAKSLSLPEREVYMRAFFGEYMGLQTAEEVLAHWRNGAAMGTALHAKIEHYLNGNESALDDTVECQQFRNFLAEHAWFNVHRTEWRIFDHDLLISGTIDCVSFVSDGMVDLIDFKRYKDVHESGKKPSKFKHPLGHLHASHVNTTAIQLNLYKYILERHYGLRVRNMHLLAMHPNYTNYQLIPMPHLSKEIDALLSLHQTKLVQRIEKKEE